MKQRDFIDFLGKAEKLKCNTRHSWTSTGRRESVAEHSWRLSLMPMLLKEDFPEVDIDKVTRMCIIHDLGEAVTGDIPAFLKSKEDEENERVKLNEFISSLPDSVRDAFSSLYEEMEALETPEAKLFKALDNMEAVISHNEAPISTWEPLEYELNLTYGAENVAWSDWLTELKREINRDTEIKIRAEKERN